MPIEFTTSFLTESLERLHYYKDIADRAMAQAPDEALFVTLDAESNSIAIIIKHLSGNMRSRWTDFLTTDGEKPWRDRDAEFEAQPKTRAEVMALWESGWQAAFDGVAGLVEADLTRSVKIRGEAHSVMQAVNRLVTHNAYHVGQIVYIAKHFAGPNWKALTIARGKSREHTDRSASGKTAQP